MKQLVLMVMLVVSARYSVWHSSEMLKMSDVVLANVEALANEESGGFTPCYWDLDFYICSKYGVGEPCYCG